MLISLRKSSILFAGIVAGCAMGLSAQAQVLTNVAPSGTAIFGYNTGGAALTTLGTPLDNAGSSSAINDNNYSDSDDTFGNQGHYGYVGITNLTFAPGTGVDSINLYMSLFGDGGWFGPNNVGPLGPGSTLTAGDLTSTDFHLQITTNNGATWSDVGFTTDYSTALNGAYASGASPAPEAIFTLDNAIGDIDGIRLVGTNGGTADGGGPTFPGFIGVKEFQVEARAIPEPSTYALMLAGLGLLAFGLRRRNASRVAA
jgi:hypothetical protein